jgi:ABC-type sulfate transport system substrate-binding protein
MTTLADLKRAIETVTPNPRFTGEATFNNLLPYEIARAEAWRTAFEWRDLSGAINRDCNCKQCKLDCAEYDEGMRLIREHLK